MGAPVQQGNKVTAAYSNLADMEFTLFGNWLGIPTVGAVTRSVYDIMKSGVIEIIEQSSRQQLTYYPSHRDEGIVWDAGAVEQNNSDQGVNLLLCEITFPQYTPPIQMNDCLADVHLMHWGFFMP